MFLVSKHYVLLNCAINKNQSHAMATYAHIDK